MKLISMTDFVLEQSKKIMNCELTHLESHHQIVDYANLLKQPLKLEMFVPCDEDGNVLEVVPYYADGIEKVNEYKKAKEKVLFEGFEYLKDVYHFPNEKCFKLVLDSEIIINIEENNTIEDLSFSNIYRLTPNAIKQLGLWKN